MENEGLGMTRPGLIEQVARQREFCEVLCSDLRSVASIGKPFYLLARASGSLRHLRRVYTDALELAA